MTQPSDYALALAREALPCDCVWAAESGERHCATHWIKAVAIIIDRACAKREWEAIERCAEAADSAELADVDVESHLQYAVTDYGLHRIAARMQIRIIDAIRALAAAGEPKG